MRHPDFRQIKSFGENFWRSKDSGGISLRYSVCSSYLCSVIEHLMCNNCNYLSKNAGNKVYTTPSYSPLACIAFVPCSLTDKSQPQLPRCLRCCCHLLLEHLDRPNPQYLFIKYIYCISPTCFGVTFTTIGVDVCALFLKPHVDN